MKKIILLTSLFSSIALAQMPPGFNPQNMAGMEKNMQAMMANMAAMEQCMNQVDQSKVEALGEKANKVGLEIEQLCKQGKRSAAQKKVISFSKEMRSNKDLQKMKKCMAPMSGMMQSMPFQNMYEGAASGKKNVCDE